MNAKQVSKAPVVFIDPEKIAFGANVREKTGSVVSLRDSIHDVGLIHPILVTDDQEQLKVYAKLRESYVVVCGARRLSAYRLIGSKIPARIIQPEDLEEIGQLQIAENEERSDLHAGETSRGRLEALAEEFTKRVLASSMGETEKNRALSSGGAGAPKTLAERSLRGEAQRAVGTNRSIAAADRVIVAAVRRYPELEPFGRRPTMAMAETMKQAPSDEEKSLRRFIASFAPREGSEAAKALGNLIDNWPAPERKKLLAKLNEDPVNVQAKALDVPPVPDDRLIYLGQLKSDLKEKLKEFNKRDTTNDFMRRALDYIEKAYEAARMAFEQVRKEFESLN